MKNAEQHLLEEIRTCLLRAIPPENCENTSIADVHAVRKRSMSINNCCFEATCALLVVQGRKKTVFGNQAFDLHPGFLMVSCIETIGASSIMEVSPDHPFLAMYFHLNRRILADLILQMPDIASQGPQHMEGGWSQKADDGVLDAFLRLARLLDQPLKARILAPLVLKELHFLLLDSPKGCLLRNLYTRGGRDNRLIDVLSWMKSHLSGPVSMSELAEMAHMSLSSFHRHFKALTGYSPLQYHKKIRLFEARRLMLAENHRVTEAAIAVGYESATQFSREYRRLFGAPPARDITMVKNGHCA